jgi:predicted ATPase/DNA-binding SARP family transcriptional activator
VEVALLGPLEVTVGGGRVAIGAPKERAVLAVLALRAGRPLRAEAIVAALWGENPPPTASKTVQTYISALRRKLPAGSISTVPGGYVLSVAPEDVDVARFERLAALGAATGEDAAERAEALHAALDLWRGSPVPDLVDCLVGLQEAARLEEMRRSAEEDLAEARLALGQHHIVVADLESAVLREPLRERRWAQLVLALYRCGRQAEALRAYQRLRTTLVEELGIAPSSDLVALERAVLAQSPELDPPVLEVRAPNGEEANSTRARPVHNLPVALSTFVGRDDELAALGSLLATHRLVTLTGPGGVGKSRLALELARVAVERFADGAWLVELAALAEPELVPEAVADALGAQPRPGQPAVDRVADFIGSKCLLLVLDNCEHLLSPVGDVAATLLSAARDLVVVATSREPLRLEGETVWHVPPLSLAADPGRGQDGLLQSDAERLFVERALAARPQLRLDDAGARAVAEVVARLDGLPLAIELAAARLAALGLSDLAARMDHRLPLLNKGVRNAPVRHQSLAATIDWSYRLLDPQSQSMFAQLSVFAGSFSLDAVEAVTAGNLLAGDAFEVLVDLVAKSLVSLVDSAGQVRYRLLETVREYAGRLLEDSGEVRAVRDRQLEWAVALAERAEEGLWGSDALTWARSLDTEMDNLRLALRWGQGPGRVLLGLRLAGSLAYYWSRHGLVAEGRRWLAELMVAGPQENGPAMVKCLSAAGDLAFVQGDGTEALSLGAQAVAMARQSIDKGALGWALIDLARFQLRSGYLDETRANLEEARALGEETADRRLVEAAISRLADLEITSGSREVGRQYAEKCVDSCRISGNVRNLVYALDRVAEAEFHSGNLAQAVVVLQEVSGHYRRLGDTRGASRMAAEIGQCLLLQREFGQAQSYLEESLRSQKEQGIRTWQTFRHLARLHLALENYDVAEQFLQASIDEAASRGNNDLFELAETTELRGELAAARGHRGEALALNRDALSIAIRSGNHSNILECLEAMASSVADLGELEEAAALWSAADYGRLELDMPILPLPASVRAQRVAALRTALTDDVFENSWAIGRGLSLAHATTRALEVAALLGAPPEPDVAATAASRDGG